MGYFTQSKFLPPSLKPSPSYPHPSISALHVRSQGLLRFRRQHLLRIVPNPPTVSSIRLRQILPYPFLDISDFRPWVLLGFLDGAQLRETNTEAHFIDILIDDYGICRLWDDRVFENSQHAVAGERPPFLVTLDKVGGVGEGLGKGNDSHFAVYGFGKFLSLLNDDLWVELAENANTTVSWLFDGLQRWASLTHVEPRPQQQ